MPKIIKELTPEQEAQIPAWIDKWLKICLSTEPAKFQKAMEGIRGCYRFANVKEPMHFTEVPSPIVGAIAAPMSAYILEYTKQESKAVLDEIYDTEKNKQDPEEFLADLPGVRTNTYKAVGDIVGVVLNRRYGIEPKWDLINGVPQIVNGAGRELINHLMKHDATRKEIEETVQEMWYWNIGGQFWCAWQAFVTYFLDVCNWETELEPRLRAYQAAQENIGWWWPFEDFCVMTDRPSHIHTDEQNRLSSTETSAIGWRDGWGLHLVNGISVPSDIIEDKSSITIARITHENNQELRRIMTDLYGHERFMKDAGGRVIAEDEMGKVWRAENPDPFVLVEVRNSTPEPDGSFKTYWLPVDPECRPILQRNGNLSLGEPQEITPRNAIASTFGLTGKEYYPDVET